MRLRIAAAIAIATLATAGSARAPTVKSGVEAWQRGDHQVAAAIWRNLAEKGDADAAFNLGQAYRLGRGVPADSALAKRWFERAATKGHVDAQVSLGLLLFDSGDRGAAMAWLRKAADKGEPRALLVVGTALFNGDGLKQDPILGYAYVHRAAAQGLAPAKSTLAEMDRIMTPEERKRGVAMAVAMAKAPKPVAKAATLVPVAKNLSAPPERRRQQHLQPMRKRKPQRAGPGGFSSAPLRPAARPKHCSGNWLEVHPSPDGSHSMSRSAR
jgi:TPR repeat protein